MDSVLVENGDEIDVRCAWGHFGFQGGYVRFAKLLQNFHNCHSYLAEDLVLLDWHGNDSGSGLRNYSWGTGSPPRDMLQIDYSHPSGWTR